MEERKASVIQRCMFCTDAVSVFSHHYSAKTKILYSPWGLLKLSTKRQYLVITVILQLHVFLPAV